jgi:hypothetical protein
MLTIKVVQGLVHGPRPNPAVRKGTRCDLPYRDDVFWVALLWSWQCFRRLELPKC